MRELERALPVPTSAKRNGLTNAAVTHTPFKSIKSRIKSTTSGPSNIPTAQRRVQVNNSYGDDASIDSGVKVDRDKLEQMAQEVVNIKSMLLMLKRILDETETSNNTVDPVLNQNNLYAGLAASEATAAAGEGATSPQLADLQRQIVLLSAQLEERDSRIERLEETLNRFKEARPIPQPTSTSSTNVATQTNRIRPLSTGPTLFQTSPDNTSTSFVSGIERKTPLSCQLLHKYSNRYKSNTGSNNSTK